MPHTGKHVKVASIHNQTKGRRFSVVPDEQSDSTKEVSDAWEVANVVQLQQFAQDKPDDLLNMIKHLREERDCLREIVEWYTDLSNEKLTLKASYDRALLKIEEAKETIDKYRVQALSLQNQAKASDTQGHEQEEETPSPPSRAPLPIVPVVKKEKSSKLPDPPYFTDGTDPTWDDWSAKIISKLERNADHYLTPAAQISYVVSRLSGQAITYTIDRRRRGATNPYKSAEELLDQLAEIYEDTDLIAHA